MYLDELLWLGACVLGTFYFYFWWKLSYFKRKGIPTVPSYPLVGSYAPAIFRRISFSEQIGHIYNLLKGHKFGGMFDFTKPSILLRDPELIKQITIKDFDHFVDRNFPSSEPNDLLDRSLISLKGNRWRDMRATLSPAFTSSKMKGMFHLVSECGKQLNDYLTTRYREEGQPLVVEMKDLWTRYTNDVIASAGFGVQCDSLRHPNNEFYQVGKTLTDFSGIQAFVFIGYSISSTLMRILGIPLTRPRVSKFLLSLVSETISTRERCGSKRPDMIHLLLKARSGELRGEEGEMLHNALELDDTDITAQVMLFFFAGFETTSILLSFSTNRLAVHEDMQRRLQEEIDNMLEENDNVLTYEAVQKMEFLDMVLSETLRMYPPAESIDRSCVKDYALPATDTSPGIIIRKGQSIVIPIYGLHHDAEYFPEPSKFSPDRFSNENKKNIKHFTYMPFGMGPRNCIGMRFALLEVKIALIYLLSRFNLQVVSKTSVDLQLSKKSFNVTVDGGFWLGIMPREK